MSSNELKESNVDDLMKMSKEELLKLATDNFNKWIKATIELEKMYKDQNKQAPTG